MKVISIFSFVSFIIYTLLSTTFASTDIAQSMVPRGKVVETFGRDFIVRTKAGTRIGIQFRLDGKFEEATGKNLNQGDELEPGDGLLSLSSAAQFLHQTGLKPEGSWVLEEDSRLGWIYELNDTVIDAKTGKILKRLTVKNPSL